MEVINTVCNLQKFCSWLLYPYLRSFYQTHLLQQLENMLLDAVTPADGFINDSNKGYLYTINVIIKRKRQTSDTIGMTALHVLCCNPNATCAVIKAVKDACLVAA